MRGGTLTFTLEGIAAKKFFTHTAHRILQEFHRVALNILLHYPLWRLQYWHFSVKFYECLFGLEGVWSGEKGAIPMMFHMVLMSSVSSYQRAVARSEEPKLMPSASSPQSLDRKPKCPTHLLKKNKPQSHQVISEKLWTNILETTVKCACHNLQRGSSHPTGRIEPCLIQWDGTDTSPPTMHIEKSK